MIVLIPGRHHLLSNHQLESLTLLSHTDLPRVRDHRGQPLPLAGRLTSLVWAITSANHAGTRRNPLPGHRREVAIEEFSTLLDLPSYTFHIDDIGESSRFADYILKKIDVDSQGTFRLTPENTVVVAGSPELLEQFAQLGFAVVVFERQDDSAARSPWELLEELVAVGLRNEDWSSHPTFLTRVSRASRRLYLKYGYDKLITDLYRHPLGTEDGDLTATRNYNVYVRAFDEGAERKAALIREHVRPGRIVDIGCCTGSLLQQLTREDRLRESDFYGIELARPLYMECLHRKAQGAFASDHVFFYQANIAEKALFSPGSVDTFTTFSLTHELESYQGREMLVRFMTMLAEQLSVGGRWLNVDVVGPDDKEQEVLLWLNQADGRNENYQSDFDAEDRVAFKEYLAGLSTYGRFLRFAQDFRRDEGYRLPFQQETLDGEIHVRLSLRDACEYLSKKDYLDNWRSEMHETFCYWSFADWSDAVQRAGFVVQTGSNAFTNPWIVKNRFESKARLLKRENGGWVPMDWPVTNMLMVAEKR